MNKTLILALAALLLLGGVYAVLTLGGDEPEVNEEEVYQQTGMSSDAITLSELDMMTIMHFKCVTDQGETIELQYTVRGWEVPDDSEYPIDDTLVEEVISPLCAVKSDRMLTEDRSTFEKYGLDPARFHVELTDSEGNVYAYNIGSKNSSTHKYYFNIEGEDKLYTVPTGVGMKLEERPDLISYIKLPRFPSIAAETTESILVETGDVRTELVRLPEGHESCYSSDYTWFLKQDGRYLPLSDSEFAYFTNAFAGMGMMNAADYALDPTGLEPYGLVEGKQHKVTIVHENLSGEVVTDVFHIGQGESGVYVRLNDSGVVGTIANKFDFFNFDYDRFKADDFFRMPLDTVDQMTILLGEERYVVRTERVTETDAEGEEHTTASYHWNGSALDAGAVETFFDSMRNTLHEGHAESVPAGAPALEIAFDRNTGHHAQMTLKLWPYDNSFYVSEFNGNIHLINKLDANAILAALESALESKAE